MQHDFHGMRVLIAEDDYLVAAELAEQFRAANAEVIGPCASLAEATRCAASSQMAVLDVDLRGQMVFPLADRLMASGVPFVFYTGYDRALLPSRFADICCLNKPLSPQATLDVLARSGLDHPQTISDMIPRLRLRARQLVHDPAAADRLLELALLRAIDDPEPLPAPTGVLTWLEAMMQEIASKQGARLLN